MSLHDTQVSKCKDRHDFQFTFVHGFTHRFTNLSIHTCTSLVLNKTSHNRWDQIQSLLFLTLILPLKKGVYKRKHV